MNFLIKLLKRFNCFSNKSSKVHFNDLNENQIKSPPREILLLDDELKFFEFNQNKFFLTKNTLELPKLKELKNYEINDFINFKFNNLFPNEFLLQNILFNDQKTKPTLVLDLDHTLIFPSLIKIDNFDFSIEIKLNSKNILMYFIKRPFLDDFLISISEHYEIIIFTAGMMQYGVKVLNKIIDNWKIENKNEIIKYCIGREYCTVLTKNGHTKDIFIKNLNILNRDLKKTILVDDKEYSYLLNPNNGQIIPPFDGDGKEDYLLQLKNYLIEIINLNDFRNRPNLKYY